MYGTEGEEGWEHGSTINVPSAVLYSYFPSIFLPGNTNKSCEASTAGDQAKIKAPEEEKPDEEKKNFFMELRTSGTPFRNHKLYNGKHNTVFRRFTRRPTRSTTQDVARGWEETLPPTALGGRYRFIYTSLS